MFPYTKPPRNPLLSSSLSLRELLEALNDSQLSDDYLSMAVTHLGESIVISLTTTGSDPITYSTVISSAADIDIQSLVFVAQHDRGDI